MSTGPEHLEDQTLPSSGTPTPSSSHHGPDLLQGQLVGGFVIEEKLGEGGFGVVYRASQPVIGRAVAIKVLSAHLSQQEEVVSRFVDEARAANQLRHRNIIDVFQFGMLDDGRPFLVMDFLEGESLAQYLRRAGTLSLAEGLPLFRAVARALDLVHDAGIVHRDLKPDNVFLTFDDEGKCLPKLLDFGIAKLTPGAGSMRKTKTGVPIGTPVYMSPEQCRGVNVTPLSDVYAMGILVYESLTGEVPFSSESLIDLMNAHLLAPPPPVSMLRPDLPESLDAVVKKALAKDPAARFQRASLLVAALDAAANDAGLGVPPELMQPPIQVQKAPRLYRTPLQNSPPKHSPAAMNARPPSAPAAKVTTPIPAPTASSALAPWKWIGGGVAAALLVIGGGWIVTHPPAPPLEKLAEPPKTIVLDKPVVVAPKPEPVPVPTPPAHPATVSLTVQSHVPATVFQDDTALGQTGEPLALPYGDAALTLTVKAAKYQPQTLTVTPNQTQALEVVLKPASATKPQTPTGKHTTGGALPSSLEDPFAK